MRVLSIDPGYERVGIALLEKSGRGKEQLLFSECFKTPKNLSFPERLFLVGEELERLISKYTPSEIAVEKLFFNSNQKTALLVSEIRGMILYIAMQHEIPIFEYTPLQIKIAVTGYGRGTKKQVIDMVEKLISVKKDISYDDEYDAIAVGLTCLASERG